MDHFNGYSDNQWPTVNDINNNDFESFDYLDMPDFDESMCMDSNMALLDTGTENLDQAVVFPESEPLWSSVVALRPSPSTFHHNTLASQTAMQSPAPATNTLDGTTIASSSSWGEGSGQTVFRGVEEAPRGSAQYPANVWESHKAEIRLLYMDQHKTLREVMDIMAQKGFRATTRMYKNRINQWGFLKNNKRQIVGRKQQEKANRSGKPPQKGLTSLKLKAARKRQTQVITAEELIAAGLEICEDHQLLAYLTSPDSLRFQEDFLGNIRDLLSRYYTLDSRYYQGVVPFLSNIICPPRARINELIQSSWFFDQNKVEHGVQFATKAFNTLLDFLDDRYFYSLLYLFISIPRWKDSGLLWKLLQCLDQKARMVLGPSHRLSTLFSQLRNFYHSHGASEFSSVIIDSMKGVFEVIDDIRDKDDYCITWLKCDYAWVGDLDKLWVERLLEEIIVLRDSLKGGLSGEEYKAWVRSMYLHLQTIRNLEGDNSKLTFDVAEDIVKSLCATDYEVQALCFRTMSRYHRGLCTMENPPSDPRHALARHCLKRATIFDEAYWGLGKVVVIQDLERLQALNTEAECWQEVDSAKVKLDQGLRSIEEHGV